MKLPTLPATTPVVRVRRSWPFMVSIDHKGRAVVTAAPRKPATKTPAAPDALL